MKNATFACREANVRFTLRLVICQLMLCQDLPELERLSMDFSCQVSCVSAPHLDQRNMWHI